jgi:hypothetical protein
MVGQFLNGAWLVVGAVLVSQKQGYMYPLKYLTIWLASSSIEPGL